MSGWTVLACCTVSCALILSVFINWMSVFRSLGLFTSLRMLQGVKQPNEDDPDFMAFVAKKAGKNRRHLEG